MFLLSFLRVIKFSLQDIGRNIWLSLVTITILILALFSVNLLWTVKVISAGAVEAVRQKIDVNLHLKTEAEENGILALKARIAELEQVKSVTYIPKAQALEEFRIKHKNDPQILEALRELGKNPLTPTLVIQAKSLDQFDDLIVSLNKLDEEIIESRNFEDYKVMISKINNITDKVSQAGLLVSLIFIFILWLVVYNAIRVAIYTHRREIKIMRLVGASNWFIRTPYLVSGLIYALIGLLAIILLYYPFLYLLQPYLEAFFIDYNINILTYFNANFLLIFGLQFLGAALINIAASLIAVGKYSRV